MGGNAGSFLCTRHLSNLANCEYNLAVEPKNGGRVDGPLEVMLRTLSLISSCSL